MSKYILEFEEPIRLLEDKILSIENSSVEKSGQVNDSLTSLKYQLDNTKKEIYNNLTRWQKILIARHPQRPHTSNYISNITDRWIEIHGDRKFADDSSIMTGIAQIKNIQCVIIGQEKGRTTKEKMYRNFGMVKPEGYRKALRVMKLAEKFNLPIITFIDTPGAYPGIGAEERGQSQAIADNLFCMSTLKVPIISIVIGEGASGGALAIGLSDKILCLEYTWYSVISPEGCASILFHDTTKSIDAANSMKVSADDLFEMGIADYIIKEPLGGAHHDPSVVYSAVKDKIINELNILNGFTNKEIVEQRLIKYNSIGVINK